MRILHIVTALGIGGVEGQVVANSERFRSDGDDVRIVALSNRHQDSIATSVPTVELNGDLSAFGVGRALLDACRVIREFRPEIVHAHSFYAILFARALRLFARIPFLVCTFHTSITTSNTLDGGRGCLLAYRLSNWLSDINTNVSHEASISFLRAGAVTGSSIMTVYDGIDTDKFHPSSKQRRRIRQELGLSDDAFVWLAVGRFCAAKDYATLLRAFRQVVKQCPLCHLVIVGDGPLFAEIVGLTSTSSMRTRVHFPGLRSDVPLIMNAADAFVLSSAWEGFPNVVAEAMASGLPTVATDCGGTRELIGQAGWVIPTRSPAALASQMSKVTDLSRIERAEISKAARARICELYSLETCYKSWRALYQSGLSRSF